MTTRTQIIIISMGKQSNLNIPDFKNFNEASVYAHRFWDYLPHNATDLHRTMRKIGSLSRWSKFIRARIAFINLRRQSVPKKQALERVFKSYHIRVKAVKDWHPTQGTPGMRKGPVESIVDRKLKTGPKSK